MSIIFGNIPALPGKSLSENWDVVSDSGGDFSLALGVHSGLSGELRLLLATGPYYDSPIAEAVIKRIAATIDPSTIHGTLITIPDFASKWCRIPDSDKPVYPGWPHGDFGERIAFEITDQLLKKVDYAIFLEGPIPGMSFIPHAALFSSEDPPMTSCHPEILKMMGHDLILQREGKRGSLVMEAQREFALPILVAQLDDVLTSRDKENWLMEKVLNFIAWAGLIDLKPVIPDRTFVATSEYEIRSSRDGEIEFKCELGDFLSEGDCIGLIRGKKKSDVSEVTTAHNGYVVSRRSSGPILVEDVICSILGVRFKKDSPGVIFCETTLDNAQMDVRFRDNLLFNGLKE